MQLTDRLAKHTRIIEIGISDGQLASRLTQQGFAYLGVATTGAWRRAIVQQHPLLAPHITVSSNRRIVRQNNAELLVLNGWAAASLLHYRNFRHVRHVALKLRPSLSSFIAPWLALPQWLLRRLESPQVVCLDGAPERLIVFSLRRKPVPSGARRYIPHALGIEGFLAQLMARRTRHAVLRWFESLPQVDPGEDLDLLISDDDLEPVSDLLNSAPGIQPIDVYTETGLPGSDFRSMPYYPPYLAKQILSGAIDHRSLCKVPAPREHFLSLAYHALYHKGASSGLVERSDTRGSRLPVDHDYRAILSALASALSIDVPITLVDLDRFLDSQGWRPAHDMLVRLARHNRWLASLLEPSQRTTAGDAIAVFLLREAALARGGIPRACRLLEDLGFRVLAAEPLNTASTSTMARSVRGGNWGKGPWPISGGPPVAAIVAYDPAPIAPTRKQRRRYPFLANARLLAKDQIRDAFNEGFPPEAHCNVVHSSDNGREAFDYLRLLSQDGNQPLADLLQQLEAGEFQPLQLRPESQRHPARAA